MFSSESSVIFYFVVVVVVVVVHIRGRRINEYFGVRLKSHANSQIVTSFFVYARTIMNLNTCKNPLGNTRYK